MNAKKAPEVEAQYKEFLKHYKLKDVQVGELLGFKNRQAWNGSHRRTRILKGLLAIVDIVRERG